MHTFLEKVYIASCLYVRKLIGKKTDCTFFYGYIIVFASFCIVALMWGTVYSFGVFLHPMMKEFGWTTAETSGAYSVFMVLHGLLYIVTGRLNDRFGPRLVTTLCGLFLGSGYLLMSRINAIWHLYLFYGVIIAIGASGGYVPLVSTVSRWFVEKRGLMTGFTVAGIGVGTMVMPPIAGWLIENHGWRFCYVIVGAVSLLVVVSAAQFLRHNPAQIGQLPYGESGNGRKESAMDMGEDTRFDGSSLEAQGSGVDKAIHTKQFWALSGLWACFVFIVQTIIVHIVPYVTKQNILETEAAAAPLMTIIGVGSIIGRILVGNLGDIIGNKHALIICLTLLLADLTLLLTIKELYIVYLFAIIFGFAYGGQVPLGSPLTAELLGMKSHGVIFGVVSFIATLGGAIGPLMAGMIFDLTNSYNPAFVICIAVSIIGLTLTKFLKSTLKEDK